MKHKQNKSSWVIQFVEKIICLFICHFYGKTKQEHFLVLTQEADTHSEAQVQSLPHTDPSKLIPRLCHLVRSETGYGFNLHSDRSRPGQYIRSLDPGSPADRAGLRPQDRLIEVGKWNLNDQ